MVSLIHPSRQRAKKAFLTAMKWHLSSNVEHEHILSIDYDDPEKTLYEGLFEKMSRRIICADNKSVVQATNEACKYAKGNILVYVSDDIEAPMEWGELIQKEFDGEDRPLVIKVDDCFQPLGTPILTIPIMNRQLYERLGYFWHPGYKSMFVDEDLYWTSRKLGALKFSEHLKFPHLHKKDGDDSTYQASARNWEQGKQFFNQRRGAGFP